VREPSGPRILVVAKRLDVGGTERHLVRTLPRLVTRGLAIALYVFERGGRLEAELDDTGVEILAPPRAPSGALGRVALVADLARTIGRWQPQIVHTFLPEPYIIGGLASVVARHPCLVMSRRSLSTYHQRRPGVGWFERHLHRRTRALLANSGAVAAQLLAETGDGGRVGVIHNGIDLPARPNPAETAAVRASLGVPEGSLLLVIVANLIAYKGHADLIEALRLSARALPQSWRMACVGRDDGIGSTLRAQAAAAGLDGHIVWLGERPDADRILAAADIGLLCSHEEGFSNALIEGMGAGVAMIATAVGGNTDAIDDGVSGRLVPVRSPVELGEAIHALAHDRAVRQRLGGAVYHRGGRRSH
jgi:glycosyltransferase involved in cell wall biosynthesis